VLKSFLKLQPLSSRITSPFSSHVPLFTKSAIREFHPYLPETAYSGAEGMAIPLPTRPPLSGGIFLKWLVRLDAFKLCSFKSLSKDFFEDIHVHIAEGLNIEASFTCFVFSQFGKLIFNRLQSAH